jgi:hypothetical protein
MNSVEIDNVLRSVCGATFLGVYAKDRLPSSLPNRPCLMVVNTEPSTRSGEHWISMYLDANEGEYFDSFGQLANQTFTRYMNKHCSRWIHSERQLQSVVSRFCGHYCIFYCCYRKIGYNLNAILSWFSLDYGLNDLLVHEFVCRRMMKIKR